MPEPAWPDETEGNEGGHEIWDPVAECRSLQKRYFRCVKKFATVLVTGGATEDRRDVCLGRFDDFQDCVTDAAARMLEQRDRKGRANW
ncbi:unnamed protein product [Sphacelaria rigidula]